MTGEIKGRAKSGLARAAALSPEKRREISMKGVNKKAELSNLPMVTHGSVDKPLRIGEIEIQCYVLNDGMRVLSQSGVMSGVGVIRGGMGDKGGNRLLSFVTGQAMSEFVPESLRNSIENPIKFRSPMGGSYILGYPADILADICEAVLLARKDGKLQAQQARIAEQCEILLRGFARVGIIALVDEATGYQRDRDKYALAKILEAFVAKELQHYVETFPAEFYEELFRLRGLKYPPDNPRFKPQYFGHLTNDIVYERIAPGVLEELKKQAAKDEKKVQLHRRLTKELGHPKLREHLASVVTAMKLSSNYEDFIEKLNRLHKRFSNQSSLKLDENDR